MIIGSSLNFEQTFFCVFRLKQFHLKNISMAGGLGTGWPWKPERVRDERDTCLDWGIPVLFVFVTESFLKLDAVSLWGVCRCSSGLPPCGPLCIHVKMISQKTLLKSSGACWNGVWIWIQCFSLHIYISCFKNLQKKSNKMSFNFSFKFLKKTFKVPTEKYIYFQ